MPSNQRLREQFPDMFKATAESLEHQLEYKITLSKEEWLAVAEVVYVIFSGNYRARNKALYPCRYPQIHASDGSPNGCPDCT